MVIRELVTLLTFESRLDGLNKTNAAVDQFKKSTEQAIDKLNALGDKVGQIGMTLTSTMSVAIGALAVGSFKASGNLEMIRTNLGTLLMDAEKGNALFSRLQKMAVDTPYETKDLATSATSLLGAGVSESNIEPYLRMLGDISMGDKEKMNRMTIQFSQMFGKGKLDAGDARTFAESGANIYRTLGEMRGKSTAEMMKMGEQNKISSDMVISALKKVTDEGGRFHGGMDRGSKTLFGTLSNLSESIYNTGAALGDAYLPELKNVIKFTLKFLEPINKFAEWFKGAPKWIKYTVAALSIFLFLAGPFLILAGAVLKTGAAVLFLRNQWMMFKTAEGLSNLTAMTGGLNAFGRAALMAGKNLLTVALPIAFLFLALEDIFGWMDGKESLMDIIVGKNFQDWTKDFTGFVDEAIKPIWTMLSSILTLDFSGWFSSWARYVSNMIIAFSELVQWMISALDLLGVDTSKFRSWIDKVAMGASGSLQNAANGSEASKAASSTAKARGLASTPSAVSSASSTSVPIHIENIHVAVPAGTTEAQKAHLSVSAQQIFNKMFNDNLRNIVDSAYAPQPVR